MSGPSEPKRFAESKFDLKDAELSPDGRWMLYVSDKSSAEGYPHYTTMAVDFAAGEAFKVGVPHALFEGEWRASGSVRSYDVTPDGQHFIVLREEDPAPDQRLTRLRVVLNWFDELRKRAPQGGH